MTHFLRSRHAEVGLLGQHIAKLPKFVDDQFQTLAQLQLLAIDERDHFIFVDDSQLNRLAIAHMFHTVQIKSIGGRQR